MIFFGSDKEVRRSGEAILRWALDVCREEWSGVCPEKEDEDAEDETTRKEESRKDLRRGP